MKNKNSLILLSVALISSIASIPIYSSIATNVSFSNIKDSNLNSSKATNYSNYYAENKFESISNASGPIVLKENGKKIVNNDWYGNENWSLDVSAIDSSSSKIVDWDFMPTHDWIFVITNNSYVIKINTYNGEILARASISSLLNGANKISKVDFNDSLYVWNSKDTNSKIIKLDRNTLNQDTNGIATDAKTNGYLGAIVPLDVGYSIGVYSNAQIDDNTSISSLTLKFIDDNGNVITDSPSSIPTPTFSSSKQFKDIAIYGFKRKNNANSTLLIIDNKFYEVKLNKSSMSQTTIAEISFKINSVMQTINGINSAFMDDNEIVYFKDKGGQKVYQIDFNNSFSVFIDLNQASDATIKQIVSSNENMLQIFPVLYKEGNNITITKNNAFLADTGNTHVTGVVNKSLYGNSGLSSLKPGIKITNSTYENRLKSNVPSIVDQTFFASENGADKLEPSNVFLKTDDIKGELIVKAIVTRNAWFDSTKKTYSIINKEYKASDNGSIKPKKISEQISWALDSTFTSWFGKYTPEQLVESDLEEKENLITIQGVTNVDTFFKDLSKKIAIKSRNKSNGQIVLSGVVSYSDKYGNYINSPLPEKTYTIKASTDSTYSLKFHGSNNTANGIKQETGNETSSNKDINMSDVEQNSEAYEYKKYLPSLIDPKDLGKFIKEENNYIPSRRTISKVSDDENGTMTLTVTYTGFPANIPYKFVQKFTGFLQTSQAKIEFKGDEETRENIKDQFKGENIKSIISIPEYNKFKDNVSSEIDAAQLGNIYTTPLDGMGYKPEIKIETLETKDVEYGAIKVTLDYSKQIGENKKLKEPYKDKFGLKEYKITQRYTGLLPIAVRFKMEINPSKAEAIVNKYNVDSNIPVSELVSILELKEYTPNEISISSFAWNGEKFEFLATAQSQKFTSVQQTKKFILDWSPKFKNIRDRNMAIAVSVAIGGTAAISTGIALYILRRNRIRRLLK